MTEFQQKLERLINSHVNIFAQHLLRRIRKEWEGERPIDRAFWRFADDILLEELSTLESDQESE